MKLRQAAFALVLLGVSGALTLGLVEAGLRMMGLDAPRVWAPDPAAGWRPIPGARRHWTDEGDGLIHINSLGFRDVERHLERRDGVARIAIFGDSQTEADQVNVDQTYSARLEAALAERHPVEVLNLGVTGYSPVQELVLFRTEAPRYRPDVVVLGLFLDNDVSGCDPALSVAPEAPFAFPDGDGLRMDYSRAQRSYDDYVREPKYTIRKYSALYRLLSQIRERSAKTTAAKPAEGGVPTRFEFYEATPGPEWERAWNATERVLATFADEARRSRMEFVVLSIPAAQVVNANAWSAILDQFPAMKKQTWDLEGPERRLREIADAHGFRVVQPYKVFEDNQDGPPLFFGNVGHMTPRGHALIARELERYLEAEKLVSTTPDLRARK